MIILDTDVTIDLLRGHRAAIAWLHDLGDEQVGVPGYVLMELYRGCRNLAEVRGVRRELRDFQVIWPDAVACNEALRLFTTAWLSHGLGILDALIGQTAIMHSLPLHTFNTRHFAAITGLQTVEPYTR